MTIGKTRPLQFLRTPHLSFRFLHFVLGATISYRALMYPLPISSPLVAIKRIGYHQQSITFPYIKLFPTFSVSERSWIGFSWGFFPRRYPTQQRKKYREYDGKYTQRRVFTHLTLDPRSSNAVLASHIHRRRDPSSIWNDNTRKVFLMHIKSLERTGPGTHHATQKAFRNRT